MRPWDREIRIVAALIVGAGLVAAGLAILAEELGLSAGGFGWKRTTLLAAGGIAAAVGALVWVGPQIVSRWRERWVTAAVVCALHLLLLAPLAGREGYYGPYQAVAGITLDGGRPYADAGFEYPPLALPLILIPEAVSDHMQYANAFAWEMIVADLVVVCLLAFGLPGARHRAWALAVYTAGLVATTGVGPLPNIATEEAALPLARFDLVPAALVLAAVLARRSARSTLWSAMLSLGTAVKAFPAALFPILIRDERRYLAVLVGAVLPLAAAAALVLALGDNFSSAITHHTGRDLQVETVAASPFLIAKLLGASVVTEGGAGSVNVAADGTGAARWFTIGLMLCAYALVVIVAWRSRMPVLEASAAAVAPIVILAPVLSPQFLLWLLPLSAAAYGRDLRNLVLVAALVVTAFVLQYYEGVVNLDSEFVLTTALRNLVLVCYLGLVLVPLLRQWRALSGPSPR